MIGSVWKSLFLYPLFLFKSSTGYGKIRLALYASISHSEGSAKYQTTSKISFPFPRPKVLILG